MCWDHRQSSSQLNCSEQGHSLDFKMSQCEGLTYDICCKLVAVHVLRLVSVRGAGPLALCIYTTPACYVLLSTGLYSSIV